MTDGLALLHPLRQTYPGAQSCTERSEIVCIFNEARAKRMKRAKRIERVSSVVFVAIILCL